MFRKTFLCLASVLVCMASGAFDKTLRADYVFNGGPSGVSIVLSELSYTSGWNGRTANMDSVPVEGNGKIVMTDNVTGNILYASSFSTLFQEWLTTDESKRVDRGYENTFLLPMPSSPVTVTLTLYDTHRRVCCEYSHPVNPDDILIARRAVSDAPWKYIHKGGDPASCIDVAILAEGYTASERGKFYRDAAAAVDAILSYEPYINYKDKFNFIAVAAVSADSGVSVPRDGVWKQTAVDSHFDTFYIERYLTTEKIFMIHNCLSGLPYEHVIVLANTEVYGGGGMYNSYTLTTAHHPTFKKVVVHEFGHSFGALADEYSTDSYDDPYYFPDVEPWEKNVSTLADFDSKWQDMIDSGVPGVGKFEGAGYQSKGVWRPAEDCRMRSNDSDTFCPVCIRAIEQMILFYLGQ